MKRSFNLIRLAAVPLSLTLISILAGSVINRVMVVELGLPVTLAGLFLAVPLLAAPILAWVLCRAGHDGGIKRVGSQSVRLVVGGQTRAIATGFLQREMKLPRNLLRFTF